LGEDTVVDDPFDRFGTPPCARFAAMKAGNVLVNVAQGGIVDEEAFADALCRDHLRGAALDVYVGEFEHAPMARLWSDPRVAITLHISGARDHDRHGATHVFCDNLRACSMAGRCEMWSIGNGAVSRQPVALHHDQILFKQRATAISRRHRPLQMSARGSWSVFELLGHRHERHALGIEDLDDLGEIGERAGQPVDLVDGHDIDLALADVGEELLQGRSLEVTPCSGLPRSAAKQAGESKRGRHRESIDPLRPTSAAVAQSPICA
jgi:hypothetical protein